MKALKQRRKKITIIEWYGICPACGKEVIGSTESQVQYNMKLHLDAHVKKEVIK